MRLRLRLRVRVHEQVCACVCEGGAGKARASQRRQPTPPRVSAGEREREGVRECVATRPLCWRRCTARRNCRSSYSPHRPACTATRTAAVRAPLRAGLLRSSPACARPPRRPTGARGAGEQLTAARHRTSLAANAALMAHYQTLLLAVLVQRVGCRRGGARGGVAAMSRRGTAACPRGRTLAAYWPCTALQLHRAPHSSSAGRAPQQELPARRSRTLVLRHGRLRRDVDERLGNQARLVGLYERVAGDDSGGILHLHEHVHLASEGGR